MAKKLSRPAQGNNTNKKIVKTRAGGDNVRIVKGSNTNNRKRGYAS